MINSSISPDDLLDSGQKRSMDGSWRPLGHCHRNDPWAFQKAHCDVWPSFPPDTLTVAGRVALLYLGKLDHTAAVAEHPATDFVRQFLA